MFCRTYLIERFWISSECCIPVLRSGLVMIDNAVKQMFVFIVCRGHGGLWGTPGEFLPLLIKLLWWFWWAIEFQYIFSSIPRVILVAMTGTTVGLVLTLLLPWSERLSLSLLSPIKTYINGAVSGWGMLKATVSFGLACTTKRDTIIWPGKKKGRATIQPLRSLSLISS